MELRQLRYFVSVAEELHFGRAARRLRIATPTLSQQLRALERDLGVVLVDRAGAGNVSLTQAGKVLLRHGRVLLARADWVRAEVLTADNRPTPLLLRVGSGAEQVLAAQFGNLTSRTSRLDVVIVPSVGSDAVQAVREERADAAVVWAEPRQDFGLGVAPLVHAPVMLALPPAHRLAGAARIPVAELAQETIVLFPRVLAPAIWDHYRQHLLPAGPIRAGQIYAATDLTHPADAKLRAVAAGRGLAPTVPAAQAAPFDGIVLRPLDPPLSLSLNLIWREPATAAVHQLRALLAPVTSMDAETLASG